MNEAEHLLACLAEECDEVGQRCMKALRFGLTEVQAGQDLTNAERIEQELADLDGVVAMLRERLTLARSSDHDERVARKKSKVLRFMEYARAQGVLTGDRHQDVC